MLPNAINLIMMSIGLSSEPKKMTQLNSVRNPVKDCKNPTINAKKGAENYSGWFTRYFIMFSPYSMSYITCMCIMMEQTNLDARVVIELGI